MKTKKQFNKLTAWLLTFVMLITFIPSFSLTAAASITIDGATASEEFSIASDPVVTEIKFDRNSPAYDEDKNTFYVSDDFPFVLEIIGENLEQLINKGGLRALFEREKSIDGWAVVGVTIESDTYAKVSLNTSSMYQYILASGSSKKTTAVMIENEITGKQYGTTLYVILEPATTYKLTIDESTHGEVNHSHFWSSYIAKGVAVTLTAEPENGYELDKLIVDGVDVTEDVVNNEYTFTMPEKNVTVSATFKQAPVVFYDVNVIKGTGSGTYQAGEIVTVTANVSEGQRFISWSSNDRVNFTDAAAATTTFVMPANDVTVQADVRYTVTLTSNSASVVYSGKAFAPADMNAFKAGVGSSVKPITIAYSWPSGGIVVERTNNIVPGKFEFSRGSDSITVGIDWNSINVTNVGDTSPLKIAVSAFDDKTGYLDLKKPIIQNSGIISVTPADLHITVNDTELSYTGQPQYPTFNITAGGKTIASNAVVGQEYPLLSDGESIIINPLNGVTAGTQTFDLSQDDYTIEDNAKSGSNYSVTTTAGTVTVTAPTTYTVTFVDWDNKPLGTDTVAIGEAATAPQDPTREGWKFMGWDKPFDSVTGDITVTAMYQEKQTIVINLTEQEQTYDGTPKHFEIKGDVTDGFTVQYATPDGNPPVSGNIRYGVRITRPEDDTYKAFDANSTIAIYPKPLNDSDITVTINEHSYVYDGNEKEPIVTVKHGNTVLTRGEVTDTLGDFAVTVGTAATEVGMNKMVVTGRNNYIGSVGLFWEILPTFETEAPAKPGEDGKIVLTATISAGASLEYADNEQFTGAKDFDASGTQAAAPGTYYVRIKSIPRTYFPGGYTPAVPASTAVEVTIPETYSITFDTDGGSEVASIYGPAGSNVAAPADPNKNGYTFLGWDKEIPSTMPAQNVTIKALWKVNPHTVTFDANGGSVTPANATTEATGKLATLPTPTRNGSYRFKGWFTASSGGTQVTTDTVFDADTTIYAQWNYTGSTGSTGGAGGMVVSGTESRYAVEFVTNGGSAVAKESVTRNGKVAEPKEPVKDGFTFEGWYTDKNLTNAYDFDTKITKSIVLYAKWSEVPTEDEDTHGTAGHNCPSRRFNDLDITQWYHLDTDYVVENDIFRGTTETTFEPCGNITRAMMITVLYRAEGEPEVTGKATFLDVAEDAYYAKAVLWGQQNGIIKGYSDTEYAPEQYILREQIAAIMHRYSQYKGYDVSVGENTNILSYNDFDSVSEYAIASMQWAIGSGLIKGRSESTLNPLDNATRAEIAAILHRYIEANK